MQLRARPETFSAIDCPTTSGFKAFSVESFRAYATGAHAEGWRCSWGCPGPPLGSLPVLIHAHVSPLSLHVCAAPHAQCVSLPALPCHPVRLYELHLGWHERAWLERRLVEAFEVEDAGLEFGGAARCSETAEAEAAAQAKAEGVLQLGGEGEGEPAVARA